MKNLGLCGVAALATLVACGSPPSKDPVQRGTEIAGASVTQPIVSGQTASSYLEAALVDGPDFYCSGSVIAPKVVLTAGHCVVGTSSWTVRTPFSGNQSAHGSSSWTLYESTGESVNASVQDVALIFLDTPISLSFYPPLASSEYADGTKGINVGRIQNNNLSTSSLFYGAAVTMNDAGSSGFPFDYISTEIIESGDSGGPVYVGTGASRVIAAVNSGAGGGTQVLARTDAVYAQLQSQIASHGGGGGTGSSSSSSSSGSTTSSGGTSGGGTSSGGSSSGGSTSGSSGGSTCTADDGSSSYATAHALGACAQGSLSASGNNWYSWSVAGSGVAYDLELTAATDAQIQMWKTVDNGTSWSQIANDTTTGFNTTANGAGQYVVVVFSPSGAPGSYELSLAK